MRTWLGRVGVSTVSLLPRILSAGASAYCSGAHCPSAPRPSIFEIVRVLKPGGIAAIIAPSSGFEHRYPVDCWRFYRDGFAALGRYVGATVFDVFTDWNHGDWDDSILVVEKPVWNDDERRA